MNSQEDIYNSKLISLLTKLDKNSLITQHDKQSALFVYLKSDSECVSITQLRLLIVIQLLSKLFRNKVKINLKKSTSENYLNSLKRLLEYFDFKESFELDLTETNPENSDLKDSIYKVDSLANGDQLRIDFGQIIQDYKLDFYDKNLKQAQVNTEDLTILKSYEKFVENKNSDSIIQVCLCSEIYQRQKVDLLSRVKHKEYTVKYCLIGHVNSEDSTAQYHLDSREKFFRDSAEQRSLISDDLCEQNIRNFTKFSLVFDLLSTNHSNEIKRFKIMPENADNCLSEHSSFILYNCARIKAILDKHESLVNQGAYSQLKSFNDLNFYSLLSTDFERKLCENYLFKYEHLIDDLVAEAKSSLQISLKLVKLFKFIEEMAHDFSKYYSKIHVLEDSKLVHLHEKMQARIYLFKLIYSLIESILNLFNIDSIKRI